MSDTWNELLLSEPYLKIGKSVFREEISEDQEKLKYAARKGNTTEVKRLLLSGMLDANRGYGILLDTPLHEAANEGHRVMVQLLLDRGANPNKAEKCGYTPLHKAAFHGHKDVIKLLLDRGANPNKAEEYGYTPLHKAAMNGHKAVAQLLLDRGAEVNMQNKYGLTPLHIAAHNAFKNRKEIVNILLEGGATPDMTDKEGRTPLSTVREYGITEVAWLAEVATILTNHNKKK